MIDMLDDHKTAIQAYRYLLSMPTTRENAALVEQLIKGMQIHIEALNGRRTE